MIDTLVLSGGGPSGIAYVGVFKALFEKNILKEDLSNIKEIMTTSVGILFAIMYMIKLTNTQIREIVYRINGNEILDMEDINIDNLLLEFGLFDNSKIKTYIDSFLKHTLLKEDLTLGELYEKVSITLTVKVYNVTKRRTEYINHKNHPDINVSVLAMMTTAIPLFFKPVEYNDNIYVDGGLRGGFPIESCKSDNFLGIRILGGTSDVSKINSLSDFPLIGFLLSILTDSSDYNDIEKSKVININVNKGLNFNLSLKDKKEIIQRGYDDTINHFKNS